MYPKKAQTTQRLIIDSIENWKDIGPSFWLIWITWWVFLIPVIFRGQIGVKVGPKSQNLGQYCHYKNLSYSKCFKRHLYNYEDYYLWPKCLLNQTLLTRFIAPKNQKMGQNGSWTKKTLRFLLAKVKSEKYPKADTWHPESIDGWSYYRLCKNFWMALWPMVVI